MQPSALLNLPALIDLFGWSVAVAGLIFFLIERRRRSSDRAIARPYIEAAEEIAELTDRHLSLIWNGRQKAWSVTEHREDKIDVICRGEHWRPVIREALRIMREREKAGGNEKK